jgi:hydrogenase-4 component B
MFEGGFAVLWLALSVIAPFALLCMLMISRLSVTVRTVMPWAGLPALVIAIAVPTGTRVELDWLLLGARLGIDEIGRVFLILTGLLWVCASFYVSGWLRNTHRPIRFLGFWLLAMVGNFSLIIAQDMLFFLLGFALMSLASYGLIVHRGDHSALRAGRIYLYWTVLAETVLFSALVMAAWRADSLLFEDLRQVLPDDLTVALIVIGFGIKAALLGLHVWLPLAYPAAPAAVATVLSGAMIKAGVLGWLRFLPVGELALPQWGNAMMIAGVLAAFYGVVIGLTQRAPKAVLAYSSISQMGLITMTLGGALLAPALWSLSLLALLLYALHHGLVKGALFMGMGLWTAGVKRGLVFAGLVFLALALVGVPLTSGALAKFHLKFAAMALPAPWGDWLAWLLPVSACGTTLLMARFLFLLRGSGQELATKSSTGLIPWLLLIGAVAIVPWLLVAPATEALSFSASISASSPIVAGVALSVLVILLRPARLVALIGRIPPGDILVWAETAWGYGRPLRLVSVSVIAQWVQRQWVSRPGVVWAGQHDETERALRRWPNAGLSWFLVFTGLLLALTLG